MALGTTARVRGGTDRSRSWRRRLLVAVRVAAVPIALAMVLHGIDLRQAGAALATADARWLLVGLLMSFLSVAATGVIWGMLVHATNAQVPWSWIAAWHARTLLAGQVVPTGTAGDAVRVVAGRRAVGLGPAIASTLVSRLCGGLGLVAWALAGTVLLRDVLGRQTVLIALCLATTLLAAAALLMTADLWVDWLGRRRWVWAQRTHRWLDPIADTLGAYRSDGSLLLQCVLLGLTSWGLNLAALTAIGHAVGADVGWQVFAVVVPVTLTATLMPLSVNGIGVREGILISLMGLAGLAAAPATALAVLVDVQMLPFAGMGALLWLGGAGESRRRHQPLPAVEPIAVPVDS